MEIDKLLSNIELQVEFIQAHLRRIRKSKGKIHTLDRDMLLNKTRDIYEKLLQLDEAGETKTPETKIELPETMPAAGVPEKADSKKHIGGEKLIRKEPQDESIPRQEMPVRTVPGIPEEPTHKTSAFDLFSSTQETIADKLGQKEESSIADKMSHHPVNDLRQIIGINEKFLFINELFKGDMSRYNKVIDDLNKMENTEGVRRYFIELKVAGQWSDDLEAFTKLQELVNRKFV